MGKCHSGAGLLPSPARGSVDGLPLIEGRTVRLSGDEVQQSETLLVSCQLQTTWDMNLAEPAICHVAGDGIYFSRVD